MAATAREKEAKRLREQIAEQRRIDDELRTNQLRNKVIMLPLPSNLNSKTAPGYFKWREGILKEHEADDDSRTNAGTCELRYRTEGQARRSAHL